MLVIHTSTSSIWMRITSVGGQCLNHCHPVGFDSSSQMRLRHWHRWGSYPRMLKTDTYMKWISTIHNIYTTLTTTTHSPPSRWREISMDMYTPAQHAVCTQTTTQRKLTPNLRDKQSTWLKTYIDFNTHQRSLARSNFLKDFFKLMNNSVFGKIQENLRKRVQVELITDADILRKRVAKPNFYRGNPNTNCLTAIQCSWERIQTHFISRAISIPSFIHDDGKRQHAYLPPIHDRNLYLAKRWYRRAMQHNRGVQDYIDNHTNYNRNIRCSRNTPLELIRN